MSAITSATEIPQVVHAPHQELPPGFLPFDEFVQKFSLGNTSTEQVHEKTKTLSQVMQADVVKGLEMLFEADCAILIGLGCFIPTVESLAPELAQRLKAGGRIFLVGSGSSGRIAIDIAAKCKNGQIRGVIAGGYSALIRAKEGFEDSEADGEKCLQPFDLKAIDTVFLISASGSASFNVGCGHFAANQGANVYYFYNSREIPLRTKQLFIRENNPVRPLEVDTGPQAISGSTRLQAASLAEACLGGLLGSALLHFQDDEWANIYIADLLAKLIYVRRLIEQHLPTIAEFVKKEAAIFSSPTANFRRLRDETDQGYVTFVGTKDTLREILTDATEMSPTFLINPIRRETEVQQKRGEYRAYLAGENSNEAAWNALVGREISPQDMADADQFLLASGADGRNAYSKRPTGSGNFVVGVEKTGISFSRSQEVSQAVAAAIENGGEGGLIVLSRTELAPSELKLCLSIENIPFERFGIIETLLLKQVLNLISNGAMVLMNKVHGNLMVDVRASNQKLLDRTMRLIKQIWGDSIPLSDEKLYRYVAHVSALKKSLAESGIYTPSVVKIVLTMICYHEEPTKEGFHKAISFLAAMQERLDFVPNH